MLVGTDRVRVTDFGLVGVAAGEQLVDDGELSVTLTQTGARVGTPLYMAAEQQRGEQATARTDQFASFVALYGRRPFAKFGSSGDVCACS